MADDMGSFRTDIEIAHTTRPGIRRVVPALHVDTGSEVPWIPADVLDSLGIAPLKLLRFRQATGAIVERWTGGVLLNAAGTVTMDEVVFGQLGDLALLGSRTLEGLNRMVDPLGKRLIDAGAMPAAVAA